MMVNHPNISNIKYIVHIADIHIRLYKRMNEYTKVFDSLYIELEKIKRDDMAIFILGDILHQKNEISAEVVDVVSNFFRSLGNIMPTFIIPGNHDANLSNQNRLDPLTPIISNLNHPNIIYLRNNDLYEFDNAIFSNMSVFSKKDEYITADKIESDKKKIALFHGVVDGSQTDTGYKLTSDKIGMSFFDGFDVVLLGDIHKRQTLQKYMVKSIGKIPEIKYCGSLIQQNYGESLDEHGFLLWDIDKNDADFYPIKNDFGYVTLNIKNGVVDNTITLPKYPKIRFFMEETTPLQLKEIVDKVKSDYSPIEIVYANDKKTKKEYIEDHSIRVSNIRNVDFQNELIRDFLKTTDQVTDTVLEKIFEINSELNKQLQNVDIRRSINWQPKIFKFSNLFSYGEDNVIDFEKIGGIGGIFGKNTSGKSSIISSLIYCLFDKCDKTSKSGTILNSQKTSFSCELLLNINGSDYIIKRDGKQKSDGSVPVKVNFSKINEDGSIESLNGEQRNDTNNIIRSYIGSYDDFILTTFVSQDRPSNFVDLTQSERKDLLTNLMDMNIFDELHDMALQQTKEFQILLKQYSNEDYDKKLLHTNINIEKYNMDYNTYESEKNEFEVEKLKLNNQILEITKKLISIDDSITDIDELNLKSSRLKRNINDANTSKKDLNTKMIELESNRSKLDVELLTLIEDDVEKKYKEYLEVVKIQKSQIENLEFLKTEIKHKLNTTNKLMELKYDPDCKFCMDNIFVQDAIKLKSELENDKKIVSGFLEEKKKTDILINSYGDIDVKFKRLSTLTDSLTKLKMTILDVQNKNQALDIKINGHNSDLEKNETLISRYHQSKDDIERNNLLEEKISELNGLVSALETKISRYDTKLRDIHSNIKVEEVKRNHINEILEKIEEMEKKYFAFQFYIESIKRDSIPYTLIANAIPAIESEINNVLSQMVDFGIMLELDGKNINTKIVYDENKIWPLELASGMERFISGIAIRTALTSISALPKTNFLSIDEGFGSFDSENASNLHMVFDYLRNIFDFVILISHTEFIKDLVDVTLDIKKIDDFSVVRFE